MIDPVFTDCVRVLEDGNVQFYLRDPGGNLIEINGPVGDYTTDDIPELKPLTELFPRGPRTPAPGSSCELTLGGAMTAPPELLTPTSPAEAAAAFGDGAGVTVMGGGTILLPELTYGKLRPTRVLMIGRAGLSGVDSSNGVVRIGAATPVGELDGRARAARDGCQARRRRRDPRGRHDRRQPLRDGRRARRRAATCRLRCSRSARASPRWAPAARRPRTSRRSSRAVPGGSCSRSTCRAASRSAMRGSTARTRTTTRCSR